MFSEYHFGLRIRKFRLSWIMTIPMVLLMLNTYTIIMSYNVLWRFIFLIGLISYIFYCRKTICITSFGQRLWLVFLVYITIETFIFGYSSSSKSMLVSLLIFSSVAFVKFGYTYFIRLIKIWNIFNLICASSMVLNVFIPSLMTDILKRFVLDAAQSTLLREVNSGVFSGIYAEKLSAAYGGCIGFVFSYSQYLRTQKRQDLIVSIIYIIAILLSGKRIAVVVPVITIILSLRAGRKDKHTEKGSKNILAAIVFSLILMILFVPHVREVILRIVGFLYKTDGDLTGNRVTLLWPAAINMFFNRPIFGSGLNTYNAYLRELYNTSASVLANWESNAHNIYLQILAETGIVGGTLCFAFFAYNLSSTIKLYEEIEDNDKKQLCIISLGLQIVFLFIGMTENTFYATGELLTYFVACGILYMLQREVRHLFRERIPD